MNVKKNKQDSNTQQKAPETLFQLIVMILKGIIKSIPKRLFFMLFIFISAFLVHTYLVIYPNGGFAMETNATFDKVLGLMGNRVRGTLVWTVGAYLLFSIGRKVIVMGPKKVLPGIVKGPVRTVKSLLASPREFLQWLSLTSCVTLLLSQVLLKNSVLVTMLLVGGITAIIMFKNGLNYHFIRLSYQDLHRLFRNPGDFKDLYYDAVQIGLIMALSFYLAFESKPIFIYVISFMFIFVYIAVLFFNKKKSVLNILLIIISVVAFSMLFKELALADDGGVEEAGGIIAWIRSEGAWLATALGFPPSFGVLLGSLLGLFVGETSWDQFTTEIGNAYDDWAEPAGEMVRDGIDFLGSVYDSIAEELAPYLGDLKDNANTAFSTLSNALDCAKRSTVGLPAYGVNTANLNLSIADTVFSSEGLGPKVEFILQYNSANSLSGHMGRGWNFNYESYLIVEKNKVVLLKTSSQYLGFQRPNGDIAPDKGKQYPKKYKGIDNVYDTLTEYETYWTYEAINQGLIYYYGKSESPKCKIIAVGDKNGNQVTFEYSGDYLTGVIDASNRKLEFIYDASGRLVQMNTPDGRQATYEYDAAGYLWKTMDMQEVPCWYEYDEEGSLSKMIVGSKKTITEFSYQMLSWGKGISTVTDGMGHVSSYQLVSEEPRTLVQTNPLGLKTTYVSQGGQTSKVQLANGASHNREYVNGLPVSITDLNGLPIKLTYDSQGQLIHRVDVFGNEYDYKYDVNGNLVDYTEFGKYTHVMQYDERSNLTSRKYPTGEEDKMIYNENGQLTSFVSVGEVYHEIEYDDFGNIGIFKDGMGNQIQYDYGQFGYYVESETNPMGNTVRYQYDNNGRITSIEHVDGSKITYTYDCCSLMSVRDELGRVFKFERDQMSYKTKEIDSEGNMISYERDTIGRLLGMKTSNGFFEKYEYGPDGFVNRITSPYKDITSEYQDGHLVSITDDGTSTTGFTYDAFGRIKSFLDPNGSVFTMEHDSLGNLIKTVDGSGKEVGFEYDMYRRRTGISDKDGVMASLEYNAFGYIANHNTTHGFSGEFIYDQVGNLHRISDENGLYAELSYDANGNLITVAYMDVLTVNSDYTKRDLLKKISWNQEIMEVECDKAGRVTRYGRSNGMDTSYHFDKSNRVVKIAHGNDNKPLSAINYEYDGSGNLTQEQGLWPLDSELDDTVDFDSYEYDVANQLLSTDWEDFDYDLAGNLLSVEGKRNLSFSYDALNRLTGLKTGALTYQYGYDAMGNRVLKVENDKVTRYLFSPGGLPLMSKVEGEEGVRSYIYSGNLLCAMQDTDGRTYYYHFDQRGNTLALTDEDGEVAARYAYSAFGMVTYGHNTIDQPFTFSGMFGVMDEGNGLFFMKSRYYDSYVGRFTQRDMAGFNGGINLYQYVGNNPMTRVDPNGTIAFVTLAAIGAGLTALGALNSAISIYRLGRSDLYRAINNRLSIVNEYVERAGANSSAALNGESQPYPNLNAGEYIDRINNQQGFLEAFGSDGGKILNDMGTVLSSFLGGLGPSIAAIKATATAAANDASTTVENILGGIPGKWGEFVTFVTLMRDETKKWYRDNC